MIRCILLLLTIVMSLSAKAEEGVIFHLYNGCEVGFVFTSQPKVVMGKELQITTSDGFNVSYDYTQVRSISCGDVSMTAIEEVVATPHNLVFKFSEDKVMVEGLKQNETVSVYNLAGQLLTSVQQTSHSSPLTIALTQRGILIIRTSTGVSYKLTNK